MNPLGEPPRDFSDALEQAVVLLETAPGSGTFEPVSFLGDAWEVVHGENTDFPVARLAVRLGLRPDLYGPSDTLPVDWQVVDEAGDKANVWDALLGGRQVVIRTAREDGTDDWFIFWGVITRLEPGYSGAAGQGNRWATAYADSVLALAETEPGQTLIGQWRRSRGATIAVNGGEGDPNECRLVTAEPPTFNPGGKPNCARVPLDLDGEKVYVFTDPGAPDAEPWTLARALRYVQWAAMQPAPPMTGELYDVPFGAYGSGPDWLAEFIGWTSYRLEHENLSSMLVPLLDRTDQAGSDALERALLRRLSDVCVDHMSTLEAFALLGGLGGLSYTPIYLQGPTTPIVCLLWTLRGYRDARKAAANKAASNRGLLKPGVSGDHQPAGGIEPAPATARGVWVYVPSDGYVSAGRGIGDLVRDENSTEGSFSFDESGTRNAVRVLGDADQYEVTVELRPGWKPDAWVDVDPNDQAAVDAAIARIGTPEWDARYRLDKADGAALASHGHVLRRWVLNEHGGYLAADYQRAAGYWSDPTKWEPYRWFTEGHVFLLWIRGDDGWSARRRRFLPPLAQWFQEGASQPTEIGIVVELSFDGGTSWRYCDAQVLVEANECAIYFQSPDLTAIVDPGDDANDFVRAYIRGQLRVRVTANVEGDDAVVGAAPQRAASLLAPTRVDHVPQRGRLRRVWRHGANSELPTYGIDTPDDRDDGPEARYLAERLRFDLETRRVQAQVVLPYLLQDGGGPWEGYRPGDEVLGVITGHAQTRVPFTGSDDPALPAARITRISWRWRREPAETATVLAIEAAPPSVIGDPRVAEVAAQLTEVA